MEKIEEKAQFKILDAILEQARTHPKGLNSLPKSIQKYIALLSKT